MRQVRIRKYCGSAAAASTGTEITRLNCETWTLAVVCGLWLMLVLVQIVRLILLLIVLSLIVLLLIVLLLMQGQNIMARV